MLFFLRSTLGYYNYNNFKRPSTGFIFQGGNSSQITGTILPWSTRRHEREKKNLQLGKGGCRARLRRTRRPTRPRQGAAAPRSPCSFFLHFVLIIFYCETQWKERPERKLAAEPSETKTSDREGLYSLSLELSSLFGPVS